MLIIPFDTNGGDVLLKQESKCFHYFGLDYTNNSYYLSTAESQSRYTLLPFDEGIPVQLNVPYKTWETWETCKTGIFNSIFQIYIPTGIFICLQLSTVSNLYWLLRWQVKILDFFLEPFIDIVYVVILCLLKSSQVSSFLIFFSCEGDPQFIYGKRFLWLCIYLVGCEMVAINYSTSMSAGFYRGTFRLTASTKLVVKHPQSYFYFH